MSLVLRSIEKSFGGTRALRGVDFTASAGEIVGLVGGNGAGKSTLMKIAAGIHAPDAGQVLVGGRAPRSPAEAIHLGVSLVRQELLQPLDLDVGANVMLGHEPHRLGMIDGKALRQRAAQALARANSHIDPRMPMRRLSPGQRQRVEIARALSLDARVLLLDEPTASLSEADAESLFALLGELRDEGLAIVYISHRLEEVLRITSRIVCLRDGAQVAALDTRATDRATLVTLLSGTTPVEDTAPAPPRDEVVLAVRGRLSFDLHAGEILGLAGLVGAGRSRVLRGLFGAAPSDLEMTIDGRPYRPRHPRDAIRAGLGYVPEERASEGLVADLSVAENVALPSLRRLLLEDERRLAAPLLDGFGLKTKSDVRPTTLSGGNQQKVVLAKWMATKAKVLLLDEPTRGLDVGAKHDVHALVRELAAQGVGIIVSSSEAEEIALLCHRALVLGRGQLRGQLGRDQLTDANILGLAA
jgi:ABC-type sugar transport system ATPase subunit